MVSFSGKRLGIVDLVIALSLGTTARLISPHGASMLAMTVLPLSLVPTFLVPLFTIFHGISIVKDMGPCFRPQSSPGLEDRGEILIISIGSGGPGAGLARPFHFFYPQL
jgi:hypothetical protein